MVNIVKAFLCVSVSNDVVLFLWLPSLLKKVHSVINLPSGYAEKPVALVLLQARFCFFKLDDATHVITLGIVFPGLCFMLLSGTLDISHSRLI